jgi:hypothetical protein
MGTTQKRVTRERRLVTVQFCVEEPTGNSLSQGSGSKVTTEFTQAALMLVDGRLYVLFA